MNIINVKNLIWLAIFSAPLYLIKFSFLGIPANIPEALITTAFISWIIENKNFSWKNFYNRHKKFLAGIFLILLGLVISALINPNHLAEWGIIKSWFAIPLILAFVLLNEVKSKKDAENIFKAIYFSATIVSFIGLIYFLRGDLTYDFRLKAFYLSPNYLAMFLSPAVFIGNYFIASRIKRNTEFAREIKKSVDSRLRGNDIKRGNDTKNIVFLLSAKALILFFLSQATILSALFLTKSYAAWTAIIAAVILTEIISRGGNFKKYIFKYVFSKSFLIASLVIITLFLTQIGSLKFQDLKNFDSRSSLASRAMIWQATGKILEDNFLWGIGPGNFQSKYLEYQKYFPPYLEWAVPQPHNLYLAFWLQGGILGLAGFLYLVLIWIRGIIKIIRSNISLKNNFKSRSKKSLSSRNFQNSSEKFESGGALYDNITGRDLKTLQPNFESCSRKRTFRTGSKKIAPVLLGIMFYILLHGIADTPYWKNDLAIIFWTIFSLGASNINFSKKVKFKPPPLEKGESERSEAGGFEKH